MPRLRARAVLVGLLGIALATGCRKTPAPPPTDAGAATPTANPATAPVYMCPMDKDIRSHQPGKCPRCGMALVTSIPDPVEYRLEVATTPAPAAGRPVRLTFSVFDPWKGNPVTRFATVHERLFHAFVVSRDLEFFEHGHPMWNGSSFDYGLTFPKTGMYRILGDFYPEASTPQLLAQTVFVPGDDPPAPRLVRDETPKHAQNLDVRMAVLPETPIAGTPVRLRFTLAPADGLERYLGAWAHMLAASDDLIDMMHTHPSIADGGPEMQFTLVFPRPHAYRIWVQFQRRGVVNTAHFDIPVLPSTDDRPHAGAAGAE